MEEHAQRTEVVTIVLVPPNTVDLTVKVSIIIFPRVRFLQWRVVILLVLSGDFYIRFIFAVDECEKCDVHAICVNGHCRCKHGYYGNGYQCEKGGKYC